MANIYDYLNWRGDITFDRCGLGEVDNLLFSMLVYVNFQGIVPSDPHDVGITLRDAAKEFFFSYNDDEKYPLGLIIPKEIITVFRRLADTPRYADLYLTGYVNEICEERDMQFSAITVRLPQGDTVVSFRGTDDTLVGWKEDFKMLYMSEVPSQRKAVEYLNRLPDGDGGLYVVGHSKGGNLAVWSSVHAERRVRDRIVCVYSNDGPGFSREMLQTEAYRHLRDRLVFLVPQSSLVGLLFFNDGKHEVVKSRARGVYQHNPLMWDIMGHAFVRAEVLDAKAKKTEALLRERLERMNMDERKQLVDLLCDLLDAGGAKTLVEFNEGKLHRAFTMVRAITELDKERKDTAWYLLSKLLDLRITVAPTMATVAKKPSEQGRDISLAHPTRPQRRTQTPSQGAKGKIQVEWRWNATERW